MTKKFFLIAGEASGDLLGSKLIKEIKSQLSLKNRLLHSIMIRIIIVEARVVKEVELLVVVKR